MMIMNILLKKIKKNKIDLLMKKIKMTIVKIIIIQSINFSKINKRKMDSFSLRKIFK